MQRILITDDSSIMRRNLRTILTQAGYEVAAEAANGEEALLQYRRHRPDLVTMDITMPVMDGLETVKRLLREDPDARVVVISAFDQRSMLFEAMENGAKQYLIKPITADKLLAVVKSVLRDAAPALQDASRPMSSTTPVSGTGQEAGPYFAVRNEEGRFCVEFADPLRAGPYPELQMAVHGLLFVKPLHLVFRFGNASRCHDDLAAAIESLIGAVRAAGGQAAVTAAQETLAAQLRGLLSVPIEKESAPR